MAARCIKRLQKEYQRLEKDPVPNIIVRPDDNNLQIWYYVIYGLTGDKFKECPYEGGVYLGQIEMPNDYPFKPPSFKIHTPNGRLKPHQLLCISISNFHPEQWSPNWTIGMAMLGMVTFMQDDADSGFGSISLSTTTSSSSYKSTCTIEDRRKYARESLQYNLTNKTKVDKDSEGRSWDQIFKILFPEFASGNIEEALALINPSSSSSSSKTTTKEVKTEEPKETKAEAPEENNKAVEVEEVEEVVVEEPVKPKKAKKTTKTKSSKKETKPKKEKKETKSKKEKKTKKEPKKEKKTTKKEAKPKKKKAAS